MKRQFQVIIEGTIETLASEERTESNSDRLEMVKSGVSVDFASGVMQTGRIDVVFAPHGNIESADGYR